MKTLLVVAIMAALNSAAAAENQSVVAFARANADRYFNEVVEVNGISLGSRVTLRFDLDSSFFDYPELFDPDSNTVTTKRGILIDQEKLSEVCRSEGRYTGQNAFGASRQVKKMSCQTFMLVTQNGPVDVLKDRYPISASQFRDLRSRGALFEADAILAPSKDKLAVKHERVVYEASYSDPREIDTKFWYIYANITAVRVKFPGAAWVEVWRQAPPAPPVDDYPGAGDDYAARVNACVTVGAQSYLSSASTSLNTVKRPEFYVELDADGRVMTSRLMRPSGIHAYDRAVEAGVRACRFPRPDHGRYDLIIKVIYSVPW